MNADDYETLPTDNVGTHMIAGAIAGVMEHCVMYPLDSVKVSQQAPQFIIWSSPTYICHLKYF